MNTPALDRRTLLRGGAAGAGLLAVMDWPLQPVVAAPRPNLVQTGALAGWLVLDTNGAGRIEIVQLDDRSQPARRVASQTLPPAASIASASRLAGAAAVKAVAAAWHVAPDECSVTYGRIDHSPTGRSIPFTIWTDFATT